MQQPYVIKAQLLDCMTVINQAWDTHEEQVSITLRKFHDLDYRLTY